MVMMVFGDEERREVMSMTDSALQCSVNNIGEEQWVSTAKSSTDGSSGKQQGGHTSPVPQTVSCWIKPGFSWNEKQKAQWFSTHSCL